MQTLITCGTPWCEIQRLQTLLEAAGLVKARSARTGSVLDIDQWHDRLYQGPLQAPFESIQPGKPWELAAAEVFLANWGQQAWGWADSRSTWLLEFWRDFDPSTRFVLLHTPAYDVLYRAMADTTSDSFDATALLDIWCAYQRELLGFYHRNRSRSVLLHARQQGSQFIRAINIALGTQLDAETQSAAPAQTVDPLLHLLVQSTLQSHPEVLELEEEIRATLPDVDNQGSSTATLDIDSASSSLRALFSANARLLQELEGQKLQLLALQGEHSQKLTLLTAQHQKQENALSSIRQENERLLLQLHQVQDELKQHHLANQNLHAQVTSARQACDALANEKAQLLASHNALSAQQLSHITELKQENELLLLQLHQVQEELEQHYLANQELHGQVASAKKTCDALANEKTKLLASHNALSAQQLSHASELKQEIERLQLQLNQARDELKQHHLANQKLQGQVASAKQTCDALANEKAKLLASHDALSAQQLNQVSELRQENELLLLQLHQVQEELEHYFLQHQQATLDKQAVEARLGKVLARYPDHTEWDRVEVISAASPLHGRVFGLQAAGRTAAVVDLAVDIVDQTTVLVLNPPEPGVAQPLLYWPLRPSVSDRTTLPSFQIDPSAPATSDAAALLSSLTPSDLQIVRAACTAFADGLPTDLTERTTWAHRLATLRQQLTELPATWRYDTVKLKHQQVNPDYEHLWFHLENVTFGERHWPNFEFRLSAANVKRGHFSYLPKLEFPLVEQGTRQFENWVEESEDERGPKFELRFDIKKKAMDIVLWNTLSAVDQAQAVSMCGQLPTLLRRLQDQGAHVSRPWSDWQDLAAGLQMVLTQILGIRLQVH